APPASRAPGRTSCWTRGCSTAEAPRSRLRYHRAPRRRPPARRPGGRNLRTSLVVLVVAALAASVPAQTIHKVPQEHATIMEAVAAAANNDTILVSAGVYQENVVIDGFSDLTLKAKGKVVISPASGTALVLSDSDNCVVSGFRFTDCPT